MSGRIWVVVTMGIAVAGCSGAPASEMVDMVGESLLPACNADVEDCCPASGFSERSLTSGPDTVNVTSAHACVRAGAGNDTLMVGPAGYVLGGSGNDTVNAWGGSTVIPGSGVDTVSISSAGTVKIFDLCEAPAGERLDGGGDGTLVTPVPVSALQSRGVSVSGFSTVVVQASSCSSSCVARPNCSGHGACAEGLSPGQVGCRCDAGFFGQHCETSGPTAPSGLSYASYASSTDVSGARTETWSSQKFSIVAGQAKLASVRSESRTTSADGSVTVTSAHETVYTYDASARLTGATERATVAIPPTPSGGASSVYSLTSDAFGNTTEAWSTQQFVVVSGQAKLASVRNESKSAAINGSTTTTAPYATTYSYDAFGNLTAASSVAVATFPPAPSGGAYSIYSVGSDAAGNQSESWSAQKFVVVNGQAKLASSVTESRTVSADGSVTTSIVEVTYL